jgi:hypothetical protein
MLGIDIFKREASLACAHRNPFTQQLRASPFPATGGERAPRKG